MDQSELPQDHVEETTKDRSVRALNRFIVHTFIVPVYKRFALWRYKRLPGIQLISIPPFCQYHTRRRTLRMITKYIGQPYYLYLIDVAGLSKINEAHGFDAGDRIIESVKQSLSQFPHATWYSMWGTHSDDFLMCSNQPDLTEAIHRAMPVDVHVVSVSMRGHHKASWIIYVLSMMKCTKPVETEGAFEKGGHP